MSETYRVQYTFRAADELQEIFEYINRDSPQNATRMIQRLLDSIESLDTIPRRYQVVRNTLEAGEIVRSMPVRPYLIRYHVDESVRLVTILSVRHGSRRTDL